MTAEVSYYTDVLYSREYVNDIPPYRGQTTVDVIKRIALVSIQFFSLHSSCRLPISLIMGSVRVWNSEGMLLKTMAVASVASSVFQHKIGMMLTTVQDIYLEVRKIPGADREEVIKSVLKIVNHLVYLALLSRGGLELSIIAFVMQAVIQLIQCRDEYNADRWIEAIANLLMAGVRVKQSYTQFQKLQRNWEIEAAIKKVYVGELHEKWRFPSDHLPIGVEVNGVRVVSWNVLNNAYMNWITEKDSQGLNGSMITDLNIVLSPCGLTARDIIIAGMIHKMTENNQVVALQECSEPFLRCLQLILPTDWALVKSFTIQKTDQDVILYNKSLLTYEANLSETNLAAYPSEPGRPIQNAYFHQREGRDFRIINTHIPGDPNKPCRDEFAKYVYQQHQDKVVTIAVGDKNFERDEMIDAYRKAGFTDFSLHSPSKTNIDPVTKQSKAIDHAFVIGDENSKDLQPLDILRRGNLRNMIQLLNRKWSV